MLLLYYPSPQWGGEENGKEKAKLMGWDKDSLIERQRKRIVTPPPPIRIHNNKGTHRATLSPPDAQGAPEPQLTSPKPAPPLSTKHDSTWYGIPHLFGQFGSAGLAVSPPGFL